MWYGEEHTMYGTVFPSILIKTNAQWHNREPVRDILYSLVNNFAKFWSSARSAEWSHSLSKKIAVFVLWMCWEHAGIAGFMLGSCWVPAGQKLRNFSALGLCWVIAVNVGIMLWFCWHLPDIKCCLFFWWLTLFLDSAWFAGHHNQKSLGQNLGQIPLKI